MPTVSVLLPVLNGEHYIKETIDSVLSQTFKDFELIVINDGSTDATANLVENYNDKRVRLISLPENQGTANATNIGWGQSDSKYVALIDSDDIAVPQRLEWQVKMMNSQPRLTATGGQMQSFGERVAMLRVPLTDGQIKTNLLAATQNLFNPTAMLRRNLVDKTGVKWDATMQGVFDWAFWCDLMFHNAQFANHPQVLLHYRAHSGQQSKNQASMRALHARVRTAVIARFFPSLSAEQIRDVEPLLQWVSPPQMTREAVVRGLNLLNNMLNQPQSPFKEDRDALNRFLINCIGRWQNALKPVNPRSPEKTH